MLQIGEETIERAKKRFDLGNPPGKDKSYGDAINWEFLLETVPDKVDLHFIGGDKDYASPLDRSVFSLFLLDEWRRKKKSELHYYPSLNNFIKSNFPEIKLKDEDITDFKIRTLSESGSFDDSRKKLKQLSYTTNLSAEQLNKIIDASLTNDQIYSAHEYSPYQIGRLLKQIIKGREAEIDQEKYELFLRVFADPEEKALPS